MVVSLIQPMTIPYLARRSVLDPSVVCISRLDGCGSPDTLSLSADELLLAAASEGAVHVYSMTDLAGPSAAGRTPPLRSFRLPQGCDAAVRCVGWCRASGSEGGLLVLTKAGVLLFGSVADAEEDLSQLASGVGAFSWSPSEAVFARVGGAPGSALVFARSDAELASVQMSHPEGSLPFSVYCAGRIFLCSPPT